MKPLQIHPLSALLGALGLGLVLALTSMAQQIPAGQPVRIPPPELKDLLSHISIVYLDDGAGGKAKTIRFEGVNVQIVNGLGATNGNLGDPASVDPLVTATNSVGNLIVGYNEPGTGGIREGSHNVVVGARNDYTSFGGLLAGSDNVVSAPLASITSGQFNEALGAWSTVGGGAENEVAGQHCAINGGQLNVIGSGVTHAAINGGTHNRILPYLYLPATGSSICGGGANTIEGAGGSVLVGGLSNACEFRSHAVVVGGYTNVTRSSTSVVVGGMSNTISENTGVGFDGDGSVIVGGSQNRAEGWNSVVVGGTSNFIDRFASASVIGGGRANSILGSTAHNCVVSGGFGRGANSGDDWVAGALFQDN